jgi:hypothetical protein
VEVAKAAVKVFSILDKTEKVVDAVIKDEGPIKQVLQDVLKGALVTSADITAAIAGKGLNWTADTALVAQVEAYFKNTIEGELVPVVEKVYGDITTAAAAPAPLAAASPAVA